jgi:molybdopterin/thiamine biosynthesis adenylyltransferase/rhodanese-related sulfurtransferase
VNLPEGSGLGSLDAADLRRYSRHLVMPEVGPEGQERLKAARVLIVGVGGLGSPAALYLAAAGVGTLGLVEFDEVDESNLQRQVLYGQGDIGRSKLDVATARLSEINPLIDLQPHPVRLEAANAMGILDGYDIVVDGSDNFATRYLVNDACVLSGKPDVYGSIFRFEGQVSIFWGAKGPCYRCLFPEPPPPGLVPSCAEGGVLGVLPGVVGSLQASEAIKLILDVGESLVGRLLLFDALAMEFRQLNLSKSDDCPICGDRPSQRELIDYDQFCGVQDAAPMEEAVDFDISVFDLKELQEESRGHVVLDVRTPREYEVARIEGSKLIPLNELPGRLEELDPDVELVVHCHHGPRSTQAVMFLRGNGFEKARNLAGGIDAWSQRVDPAVPRY